MKPAYVLFAIALWPQTAPAYICPFGKEFCPPPNGSCAPGSFTTLAAAAGPSVGTVPPTVVVRPNTVVSLIGTATTTHVHPDCTVATTTTPGILWSLTFQPVGGLPGAHPLTNPTKLDTFFDSGAQRGTWVATLRAGNQSASVTIEVLAAASVTRTWFSIGPDGTDDPHVGRINTIAFDPHDPSILWAGSGRGGVWKSPDRGGVWWPMMDHKNIPTMGVASLAVATNGTVYAGIGDSNPNNRNFDTAPTAGVFKSTDGGVTWSGINPLPQQKTCVPSSEHPCRVGPCNAYTGFPNKVVVDPSLSSRIFVADGKGVFTNDGGRCWVQLYNQAASDVVVDPLSPTTLFVGASNVGVVKLDNINATPTATTVLPFLQQKIVLAFAPSNPQVGYALGANGNNAFLIQSTDHFGSLQQSAKTPCAGLTCLINEVVAVDPNDANHVFYGDVHAWESRDGGATFKGSPYPGYAMHDDQRAFAFAPDDPTMLYASGDGGVYRVRLSDFADGSWEPRTRGLIVGQVFGLASAPSDPHVTAIGTWDTGTKLRTGGRAWELISAPSDGVAVTIDAASPTTVYYDWNAGNGGLFVRWQGKNSGFLGTANGLAANPFVPGELIEIQPAAPADNRMYAVENANSGTSFNMADQGLTCADPTPSAPPQTTAFGLEFISPTSYFLSDNQGNLFNFAVQRPTSIFAKCSAGTNAQPVNPPPFYTDAAGANTIVIPAADPFNPNQVYARIVGSVAANRRVVLLTGQNQFQSIVGDLPTNVSLTSAIAADPVQRGVVYVGSLRGLWAGVPDSSGAYHWSLAPDIPDTQVNSIVQHRNNSGYSGRMRVGTFSRGVWEAVLPPLPRKFSSAGPPDGPAACLVCPPPFGSGGPRPFGSGGPPQPRYGNFIVVDAPYVYRGEAGLRARLRAVPTVSGVEQPYFISQVREVEVGEGTVPLAIGYSSEKAPLGMHSDGMRFELLPVKDGGTPVVSSTVAFDHWWVRPEARLLRVSSESERAGKVPVNLQATIGEKRVESSGTLTVPVRTGTPVTLQAPERVEVLPVYEPGEKSGKTTHMPQRFSHWVRNGKAFATRPPLHIRIVDDTDVTAAYRGIEKREDQRRPGKR